MHYIHENTNSALSLNMYYLKDKCTEVACDGSINFMRGDLQVRQLVGEGEYEKGWKK